MDSRAALTAGGICATQITGIIYYAMMFAGLVTNLKNKEPERWKHNDKRSSLIKRTRRALCSDISTIYILSFKSKNCHGNAGALHAAQYSCKIVAPSRDTGMRQSDDTEELARP